MHSIVLPDLNQKTIDDLRDRVSKAKIDLPALQDVGKSADHAIDRLLGRSRAPIWPWIATAIGVVAIVGAIAAWLTSLRRPEWVGTE